MAKDKGTKKKWSRKATVAVFVVPITMALIGISQESAFAHRAGAHGGGGSHMFAHALMRSSGAAPKVGHMAPGKHSGGSAKPIFVRKNNGSIDRQEARHDTSADRHDKSPDLSKDQSPDKKDMGDAKDASTDKSPDRHHSRNIKEARHDSSADKKDLHDSSKDSSPDASVDKKDVKDSSKDSNSSTDKKEARNDTSSDRKNLKDKQSTDPGPAGDKPEIDLDTKNRDARDSSPDASVDKRERPEKKEVKQSKETAYDANADSNKKDPDLENQHQG